jgi:sporulation-control protein spo0M
MHANQATLHFDKAISRAIWPTDSDQKRVVPVAAGQTIRQALETEGIRLPRAAIALVKPQGASSGLTSDLNHVLQPGDSVRFLFQISGGSVYVCES